MGLAPTGKRRLSRRTPDAELGELSTGRRDLGAAALYLTPVFSAYSNHKYDTVDFDTLDPMFGDERVLGELIMGCTGAGCG